MKACTKCLRELAADQFSANTRTRDGKQSWCKACTAEHSRKKYVENHDEQIARGARYRADHREQLAEYNRAYRRLHRAAQRPSKALREARRRTRRAGDALILDFTLDELTQRLSMFPGCWICGGPPDQVDHVKPISVGGANILANLRPVCGNCNQRKKDQWPYAVARPAL